MRWVQRLPGAWRAPQAWPPSALTWVWWAGSPPWAPRCWRGRAAASWGRSYRWDPRAAWSSPWCPAHLKTTEKTMIQGLLVSLKPTTTHLYFSRSKIQPISRQGNFSSTTKNNTNELKEFQFTIISHSLLFIKSCDSILHFIAVAR